MADFVGAGSLAVNLDLVAEVRLCEHSPPGEGNARVPAVEVTYALSDREGELHTTVLTGRDRERLLQRMRKRWRWPRRVPRREAWEENGGEG